MDKVVNTFFDGLDNIDLSDLGRTIRRSVHEYVSNKPKRSVALVSDRDMEEINWVRSQDEIRT